MGDCGTDGITNIDIAMTGDGRNYRVGDLRQVGPDGQESYPDEEWGDARTKGEGRGVDHCPPAGDQCHREADDQDRDPSNRHARRLPIRAARLGRSAIRPFECPEVPLSSSRTAAGP